AGYAAGTGGIVLKGTLAGGTPLTLVVTPLDPPVEVPPGGSFRFTVQASNTGDEPVTFDLWAEATHGDTGLSVTHGPRTLTLPAGASRQFTVTQRVPLRAPAGEYAYTIHAGDFPDGAVASDGFPVTVLGTPAADGTAAFDWDLTFDATEVGAGVQPARHALEQNAPNPFRAESVIRYALPEGAHVTLRVYDVLGQEVAVLVDGYREAGRHAVTFDASALSAGTYLYRLEAGTFTATRTMHLVK
ncbi:MAG TPA: T9SS type A sorting domain-containing protein, partial [Rubricoccaceae bacterium]|nr:T9SS type A sorting domain-containing protein [Rubricoccaceae bacterium]